MQFEAKASRTVRNKNYILIAMCAGFLFFFAYDGFYGWPAGNDVTVKKAQTDFARVFNTEELARLQAFSLVGQDKSTPEQREAIYVLIKTKTPELTFRQDYEISLQRLIVLGLIAATIGSIWYFFKCQKRRAILDVEARTLSPKPGLTIPVDAITIIDNTRWKKTGIVDITYKSSDGTAMKTDLDDYKLDSLPPLLNELSTLAEKAELIPRPVPESAPAEPDSAAAADVPSSPDEK